MKFLLWLLANLIVAGAFNMAAHNANPVEGMLTIIFIVVLLKP